MAKISPNQNFPGIESMISSKKTITWVSIQTSTPSDDPLPHQRNKQSKKYHLILKLCNKYIANIVIISITEKLI